MLAVPLVSSIMTRVAGVTLTAQADPTLYSRGFQAACMVVICVGLIALAFALVSEGRTPGRFRRAAPVCLSDTPGLERGLKDGKGDILTAARKVRIGHLGATRLAHDITRKGGTTKLSDLFVALKR
jgi:hypothetical protein